MNQEQNEQPKTEIREHLIVKLRFALAEHGLPAGTAGTVVHLHAERKAFEVEFAGGKVITLEPMQIELVPYPYPPISGPVGGVGEPLLRPDPSQPLPAPRVPKPRKRKETKADRLFNAAQAVLDAVEEAREKVDELNAAIEEAKDDLASAIEHVQEKMEELKQVREDEYQGWYDNLPEGLQQSATGEKLSTLLEIDLDADMPEVPELEEISFDDIEQAAQEVLDAELPQGFGRD